MNVAARAIRAVWSPDVSLDRVQCVIFDMDGTITRPQLNFDDIRAALDLPSGPILEQLPALPPERRAAVERGLYRFEMEAAIRSELQSGAGQVIGRLQRCGVKTALLTRNCRSAVDVVLIRHGLRFDLVRTREDGTTKPSGEPILRTCRDLGVAAERTWSVGDYRFDVLSGRAAGATTVLLVNGPETPPYADEADHVIRSLAELLPLLEL